MLQTLARNPRTIAWFLVTLFYLELVMVPVAARANSRPISGRTHNYSADTWKAGLINNKPVKAEAVRKPDVITENTGEKKANSPLHVKGVVTTGPTQPEMQSFQSVNGNNLVDPFSGDFSYNIPLLDVGGYPVNLHYQSGVSMDQEASWVGLGWNINPGVISRNMRGLPDDFQGEQDKVEKTISIKPNKTVGVTIGGNIELFGFSKFSRITNPETGGVVDSVKGRSGVLGVSLGVFHNTYKGWGTEYGLNANINAGSAAKTPLSAGLGITNNSQTGFDFSPSLSLKLGKEHAKRIGNISIGTNYNSNTGIQNLQITGELKRTTNDYKKMWRGGLEHSLSIGFARPSYTPAINIPYTSSQFSLTTKVGSEHWALHPNFYIRGYSSIQKVEDRDKTLKLPAYGYLYYDKAGKNRNVLLDFNREKDVPFSDNSPHIAVPIYTYDTWSITGEGTGGSFRAYRGDIGYVFDHAMTTKSNSNNFSLDLGFGQIFHGGVDYNRVDAYSKTNPWEKSNNFIGVVPFKQAEASFENVYFKNPGEKTTVNKRFLDAIGNDSLIRVNLSPEAASNPEVVTATRQVSLFHNGKAVATRLFDANTFRQVRDKRTQVISYLSGKEACAAGLDTIIKSYQINAFPITSCDNNYEVIKRVDAIRKAHHLSEITVLNADGRRYVYGVPVYNITQSEVTMSTQTGDNATGLVGYSAVDNSPNNNKPKDGYYNHEKLSAYSHSFLLSGILSSDYVDITGDGITEDDNGDAVKFNYSRIYRLGDAYKWRAPYQQNLAAYNEGLKTDSRDERGSYTYGEREVWYLNSIESKTMIATFVLETDSIRQDSYGVLGENGGQDVNQRLFRLKKINLYAKADYLKNGPVNAKPVKTVHFDYSYELCRNNPGSLNSSGKLTLKRVWFSYNKNEKGRRNPYIFTYNTANPDFSQKSVDRWGNYKDPKDNPGGLTNADYPYALQSGINNWNADKAAAGSAPWTLSQIKLPSGATLKVTYESDDYAYVQNKRAMQFFSIAGFGSTPNAFMAQELYQNYQDHHYVFINVTEPVTDKNDITRKYLEGVNTLFFKLAVNVPGDRWGRGYEIIPVYAEIEDYGVRSGSGNKIIWIKVKPVKGDDSPFATTALQFLRLNLPSKAYPFSEPGDNLDIKTLLGSLASVANNVKNAINSFNSNAHERGFCKHVETDKSFVRLNNPVYRKLGGGLRVKKVEVFDNFNKMTGHKLQESVYGQTYTYTDSVMINGVLTAISSGVATYEPMIGNDENPFRVPLKLYTVKVGALAPADYMYTEEPFAETFFPAPMVGYSKVRVRSIHKDRKSANGFEETEFYTAKEFPVIVEYTPIDDKTKKTYNPKIQNFLNFDAKHFVTLSQGFKIELNDMNGKLKAQASYAENDPKHPISYTYNYYRLKNDNAAQPKLLNTVAAIDSANGIIDTAAEIGKEVELMIDVREETSYTLSNSLEVNADFVHPLPPINIFTGIPLPSAETNRYRSIAVLKIVNRYGMLDSIIHEEKGSTVTTRNLVYDGETGDVLLSQTNNEFDDPVYNFNYPAHWAYSGMEPAYKNIGTVLKVNFRKGIMKFASNERVPVEKYFESGDELLVFARDKRKAYTNDACTDLYYQFEDETNARRIWAVDAAKGKEGQRGIYFIDRDGIPYSADGATIKIVRSGKRNMAGIPIGAITSLHSPVKKVNNVPRLVFDATTGVIAASAARFRDLWAVDSTLYAKDTLVRSPGLVTPHSPITLVATDHYSIRNYKESSGGNRDLEIQPDYEYFEASSYNNGGSGSDEEKKGYLKFDMSSIPKGALITSAKLYLFGRSNELHRNSRISNACYLERLKAVWPRQAIPGSSDGNIVSDYFYDEENLTIDRNNRIIIPETARDVDVARNDTLDITAMAQDMLDQYYSSEGVVSPAMRMSLVHIGDDDDGKRSRLTYSSGQLPEFCPGIVPCNPFIVLTYYDPCGDGSRPYKLSTSGDGGETAMMMAAAAPAPVDYYYCNDKLVDSPMCKPNINDTALNFYRFGILGNWRMDRAYTYYGNRVESDPADSTNIRVNGIIQDFAPYWSFTNARLAPSSDSTRWVWNSELTHFNNKGYEIENHDPLNRYNAGQYGYNQSMPVAVAQNAQSREIGFDGFEDYGYQTDACKRCKPYRHFDLGSDASLVDSVRHTGLHSVRVNGNSAITISFKIGTRNEAGLLPELSMKEDSIPLITSTVNPQGTGLTVKSDAAWTGPNICGIGTLDIDTNINFNVTDRELPGLCRTGSFNVEWNGYIQPRYTGTYRFLGVADDNMSVHIWKNGVDIDLTVGTGLEGPHEWLDTIPTHAIDLQAGELYQIRVIWTAGHDPNQVRLEWQSEGLQPQSREVVPANVLYPWGSDLNVIKNISIRKDTTWCVQLKNPTGKHVINKRFSPLQGQKVVISGWVKQEGQCISGNYDNAWLNLGFNDAAGTYVTMKPTGNIIEGWQRIEDTLTIPNTATELSLTMRAASSASVYFDDIRIQPFNANMKSFVYNPVNLRLMAELDENNYATFYEYDDDGTLIRLKKETERGIKTIKETRSALLKENDLP
ncbi:PA14 domain-containing protein [Longitalea luteola]|uniref:PA14 domain-containing protein n=1 Tax=Longitalea luteola TaxID=2812563 RepID=UPI001A96E2BA|nr:PA14 domain-containing protein [Longitalea luteola]